MAQLMALKITQRCRRCRKPMRNDGTDAEPKWVCNTRSCVCYVPPPDDGDSGDFAAGKVTTTSK